MRHINRTHVELGKKLVVNKEGGFRLFDYLSESGGPIIVDYSNGTVRTFHPPAGQPKLFTELGVAFDVVLVAATILILLRLALAAFRAVRRYRNYMHFHEAYIGTDGRERKEAYRNLVRFAPQPTAYNKFFSGKEHTSEPSIAYTAGGHAPVAPAAGGGKAHNDQGHARSASFDSTVMIKTDRN